MDSGDLHYHIHWSEKASVDWQRFDTRADAKTSAKQLALPGETYTIEEHDKSCSQCMKLMRHIPAPDPSNEASQ
jgi:hypothetical protein